MDDVTKQILLEISNNLKEINQTLKDMFDFLIGQPVIITPREINIER